MMAEKIKLVLVKRDMSKSKLARELGCPHPIYTTNLSVTIFLKKN